MGLLWIEQKWEEDGREEQSRSETTLRFVLEMSSVTDGKKQIRAALPQYAPYQQHPTEKQLYVASFAPTRQQPGANIWDLEVLYSTDVNLAENPLALPAKITVDTDVRDEPSLVDVDGVPYMTTAGELIEGSNEVCDLVFSVQKFIPIAWPSWIKTYGGAVNSDDVRLKGETYPAGTLKIFRLKIGEDQSTPQGTDYCQLDMEIHYRESGWKLITPNRGFYQRLPKNSSAVTAAVAKAAAGGKVDGKSLSPTDWAKFSYVKILVRGPNNEFEEPSEPQLLDRNGRLIENPTPSSVVLLTFTRNRELAFSQIANFLK